MIRREELRIRDPFIVCEEGCELKEGKFGLANVAPTVLQLMGLKAPDCWLEGMLK